MTASETSSPEPTRPMAEPVTESMPATDTGSAAETLPAARTPVGTGPTPLYAQLIALALIVIGVILIRDALVSAGAIGAERWSYRVLSWASGMQPAAWLLPASVVVIILGVLLVVLVVKPRPRKAVALNSKTGVFLRTRDLARVAREVVSEVDGITAASASAGRRVLSVHATTITDPGIDEEVTTAVEERLAPTLSALENPPRLKVGLRHQGGQS